MSKRTQELLEAIMAGHEMTPYELDELVNGQVPEDQFLDFKNGKVLEKKKSAPAMMVREYVSGFANSAGGILIVGVDEDSWSVTGCSAPGGGSLTNWASKALTPIVSSFSVPPRFHTVAHENGEVLIVATERSPKLISCNVHGEVVYYMRMDDQTLRSPEYLVADILLGKRQFPYLSVSDMEFYGSLVGRAGFQMLSFGWKFIIENEGFLAANNPIFGFIYYDKSSQKKLNQHLRANIQVLEIPSELSRLTESYNLIHIVRKHGRIDPFEIANESIGTSEIPVSDAYYKDWIYTWHAALYVIAQDAPPIWYQVSMRVDRQTIYPLVSYENVNKRFPIKELSFVNFERVSVGKRPLVGWQLD